MSAPKAALTVAVVALTTDMVVYGIAVPTLPAIAHRAGAGSTVVGLLFAAYAAALLAVTPLAGRWVDRRGFRVPMLVGLLGLAAATSLFAMVDAVPLLIVGRVAQGAAAGVTWTASLALIAAFHAPAQRGRAMGIALSGIGIGALVGPPVGGLLYEHGGRAAPFVFAAALAAGDGVARWVLVKDPAGQVVASPGYRTVVAGPGAKLLVVSTALGAFALAFTEPILPLRLGLHFGASSTTIGVVFGAAALISSAVAPSLGGMADRLPRASLVAGGAVVAAGGLAALAVAPSVLLSGVSLAVVASGAALVLVATLALIADLGESFQPPSYGSAYALYGVAYAAGLTVAPLAAGAISGAAGFVAATAVAGATCAVVGIAIAVRTGRRTGSRTRRRQTPAQAER